MIESTSRRADLFLWKLSMDVYDAIATLLRLLIDIYDWWPVSHKQENTGPVLKKKFSLGGAEICRWKPMLLNVVTLRRVYQ